LKEEVVGSAEETEWREYVDHKVEEDEEDKKVKEDPETEQEEEDLYGEPPPPRSGNEPENERRQPEIYGAADINPTPAHVPPETSVPEAVPDSNDRNGRDDQNLVTKVDKPENSANVCEEVSSEDEDEEAATLDEDPQAKPDQSEQQKGEMEETGDMAGDVENGTGVSARVEGYESVGTQAVPQPVKQEGGTGSVKLLTY
jgi:hypothetical protein